MTEKVCIIGGGVAGLSCAWALAKRGFTNIDLFEQEAWVFSRASGMNAAIWRPLEEDVSLTKLAQRSRRLLSDLERHASTPLVRDTGLLLLESDRGRIRRLKACAREARISTQIVQSPAARWPHLVPHLPKGIVGVFCPSAGVLDPHAMGRALAERMRKYGIRLHFNTQVTPRYVRRKSGWLVNGVVGQAELDARCVIVATGALTSRCVNRGQPALPLLPLQRHLVALVVSKAPLQSDPVIWAHAPEFYLRRESAGVLASPCDETIAPEGIPRADLDVVGTLSEKVSFVDEGLCSARVRRYWACVRTKTFDGKPLIARDPQVAGLCWLSGFGGFGMSGGLAAADLMAEGIERDRFERQYSLERFLHMRSGDGAPV